MKGRMASAGMAYAAAALFGDKELKIERRLEEDTQLETERFEAACVRCMKTLEEIMAGVDEESQGILDFQLLMLEDTDYLGRVRQIIQEERCNAEYAVQRATRGYADSLSGLTDNDYLRERATDVMDLAGRLVGELMGVEGQGPEPDTDYIAVAWDLTPSQVAAMDRKKLRGIVLEKGGMTSHAVIIARSLGIPCLIEVMGALEGVGQGQMVLLDAGNEAFISEPREEELARYRAYQEVQHRDGEELEVYRLAPTQTRDGKKMQVFANITSARDALPVVEQGGEGVGLFRTELLYMEEESAPPDEEKQFQAYRQAAEGLRGRPLIIRTLDVGGDKKIAYLGIDREENPFLGYRAIRYCLDHRALFKAQLLAILRASAFGEVRIMLPMITELRELRETRALVEEIKTELAAAGTPFDRDIALGIMVETPAAAFDAQRFAREADFFSIGTNDLAQYLFAADRGNERVSRLNCYFQPTLLRAVDHIAACAHAAGIEVGICGQAGEAPQLIPLWIAMGIDELSVSIPGVMRVRRAICMSDEQACKRLLGEVLSLDTAEETEKRLSEYQTELRLQSKVR